MAVWNDLEPGHEAAFDAWYEKQHVPERLHVPGFRSARRYSAAAGSPRYCAFYWLDDVEVLASPVYRERLANPTKTTTRMMQWFRGMARTPCTITLQRGESVAEHMGWVAAMDTASSAPPLASMRALFDRLSASRDLARMQLWQCAASIAGLNNPEERLRAHDDSVAAWIVFVEGRREADVETALDCMAHEIARVAAGEHVRRSPIYRLVSSLRAEDAPLPCSDDHL